MDTENTQNNLPYNNPFPTEKLIFQLIEDYFSPDEPKPNYEDLHFNLLSLLEISQKLIFEHEEILDRETKNHIYNLLDLAKDLVNKDEYEFMDKIKEYMILASEEMRQKNGGRKR